MNKFLQLRQQIERETRYHYAGLKQRVNQYWTRLIIVAIVLFVLTQKDLSINFNMNTTPAAALNYTNAETMAAPVAYEEAARPMNVSLVQAPKTTRENKKPSRSKTKSGDDNLANTFSNLNFGEENSRAAKKAAKRKKQQKYVDRFSKTAIAEMERYGIPASITLAQGLLESNVGESKLATRNNNHFGIKCFSKTCGKNHCSNFTDDSHKDFFRKYGSAWESYRAHSQLLKNGKRYRSLFGLRRTDYKGWARGLRKAGYATDKKYDQKLIYMIEELDLHEYDQ